jgi:hypothetical protein
VGVGEAGPLAADPEVARQRQLKAAGHGDAVDRPDHRDRKRQQGRQVAGRELGTRAELDQVQARAEGGAGAGENDRAQAVVLGELAKQPLQGGDELRGERVIFRRAVQRDDGDAARRPVHQHEVGHDALASSGHCRAAVV